MQQVKSCGICTSTSHPTDMCPTLQEYPFRNVNSVGGFLGPPQRNYDSYANIYNPGWSDYPNFSYGVEPQYHNFQLSQPTPPS
ncbi:hypothetical protein PTKIN_Ptkin10aG0120800 [Pterospermum kingtungense]